MGLGISKLVRGIVRTVKGKPRIQTVKPLDFNVKPKELKKPIPFDAFSKESLKKAEGMKDNKIVINANDIFGQ